MIAQSRLLRPDDSCMFENRSSGTPRQQGSLDDQDAPTTMVGTQQVAESRELFSESSRLSGGGMDTRGLSRLLFLSSPSLSISISLLLLSSSFSTSSTLLPSSSSHLLSPSTPFFSSLLLLSRSPHGAVGAPDDDLLSQPTSNFVNTEPSK